MVGHGQPKSSSFSVKQIGPNLSSPRKAEVAVWDWRTFYKWISAGGFDVNVVFVGLCVKLNPNSGCFHRLHIEWGYNHCTGTVIHKINIAAGIIKTWIYRMSPAGNSAGKWLLRSQKRQPTSCGCNPWYIISVKGKKNKKTSESI